MISQTTTAAGIMEAARDALAADTVLLSWCNMTFGKDPSVYLGIDEENPPASGEYPLIAILGISQNRAEDKREVVFELALGVAIIQEAKAISGISTTYTGMTEVETFRELCEDAIFRAGIGAVEGDGESVSISDYPLFSSFTTISFKALKTTRRGLPAR